MRDKVDTAALQTRCKQFLFSKTLETNRKLC